MEESQVRWVSKTLHEMKRSFDIFKMTKLQERGNAASFICLCVIEGLLLLEVSAKGFSKKKNKKTLDQKYHLIST